MKISEVYSSFGSIHKDLTDSLLAERGLENNFGATFVPQGTKINKYETHSGVFTPVLFKGKAKAGVIRDQKSKQYYRFIDENLKYPLMYNLDEALKDLDYVILAEGVYDSEAVKQSLGINNVMATLGASIKQEHLITLSMFNTIFTCFDNDEAGTRAHSVIYDFFDKYKPTVDVKYIELPSRHKDVNDFLIAEGKKAVKKHIITEILN